MSVSTKELITFDPSKNKKLDPKKVETGMQVMCTSPLLEYPFVGAVSKVYENSAFIIIEQESPLPPSEEKAKPKKPKNLMGRAIVPLKNLYALDGNTKHNKITDVKSSFVKHLNKVNSKIKKIKSEQDSLNDAISISKDHIVQKKALALEKHEELQAVLGTNPKDKNVKMSGNITKDATVTRLYEESEQLNIQIQTLTQDIANYKNKLGELFVKNGQLKLEQEVASSKVSIVEEIIKNCV